jgi:myo-inositol-1(or 4)-monophosphatase
MTQPQLDLEAVITVARRAGQLVLKMRREGLRNVQSKSTAVDLVTEADLASEAFLREELTRLCPGVGFWGEESNQQPKDELFWIVDPIDGTVNYANGIAFYAVNIALQQGENTLLGVTIEPPSGRIFWARQGGGAYLREPGGDQRRLQPNTVERLSRALVSTGFPYHRVEAEDNNVAEFRYFVEHSQGARSMGSAAMDLAHVASGATAAYWEAWLNPWDAAPGVLMVREAGGQVTDYAGNPWRLESKSLVASNGNVALHEAMLEGIAQARATLTNPLLVTG